MALSPRGASHWYGPDGTPQFEIALASDAGRMRPTTIRDAKKYGWLPSVTTIQKEVNQEFLNTWRIEQGIRAALANSTRLDGEDEDGHIQRIERAAHSIVDTAAKRGTLIHEAIEQYVNFGTMTEDTVIRPLVEPYFEWHRANVQAVDYTEKTVIHRGLGFAGRLDMKAQLLGRGRCIMDYKSRKRGADGKLAVYDSNGEQLEAYRQADAQDNEPADRCVTVIINSQYPDIHIHEWPADDCARFWEAFQLLLKRWQILKKFTNPIA